MDELYATGVFWLCLCVVMGRKMGRSMFLRFYFWGVLIKERGKGRKGKERRWKGGLYRETLLKTYCSVDLFHPTLPYRAYRAYLQDLRTSTPLYKDVDSCTKYLSPRSLS